MEIERIYHPYDSWEDFKNGMYKTTCYMDPQPLITECEDMLKCKEYLWESMNYVTHHWKLASQHNLTNMHRNRQAWIGQAACCFAHGAPEYITKLAWNNLNPSEQDVANKVADEVIQDWEEKHLSGYFERVSFSCPENLV